MAGCSSALGSSRQHSALGWSLVAGCDGDSTFCTFRTLFCTHCQHGNRSDISTLYSIILAVSVLVFKLIISEILCLSVPVFVFFYSMHMLFSSAILTWNEKQKTVFAPALCSPARRRTAVTEWRDSSAICQDRCHRVLCAQTQLLPYTCRAEQTGDRDDSHWRSSSYSSFAPSPLHPLGK